MLNAKRVDMLEPLWTEGSNAGQAANRTQDVNRRAVMGEIHRLHEGRTPNLALVPAFGPARSEPAEAEDRAWLSRGGVQPEEPGLATFATLSAQMCRWPIGDPETKDFTFCGKDAEKSRPYCQCHARLAYRAPPSPEADMAMLRRWL